MRNKRGYFLCTLLALAGILAVAAGCSSSPPPALPSPPPAAAPAPAPQPPPAPVPPAQRQGAIGIIAAVSGNVVTLTTLQGQVTVTVNPGTAIEKSVSGALADLAPGQFITATGNTTDSAGNVNAAAIVIRPQGQVVPVPPSGFADASPGGRFGRSFNGTAPNPGAAPNSPLAGRIGRGVNGTITAINGSTLTVANPQNPAASVAVNVSPDTAIEKTVSGSLADLSIGAFLTVFGATDSSGNIDAVSIQITPQPQRGRFTPPGGG